MALLAADRKITAFHEAQHVYLFSTFTLPQCHAGMHRDLQQGMSTLSASMLTLRLEQREGTATVLVREALFVTLKNRYRIQ